MSTNLNFVRLHAVILPQNARRWDASQIMSDQNLIERPKRCYRHVKKRDLRNIEPFFRVCVSRDQHVALYSKYENGGK